MLDLLTVGTKFTRTACRAAAAAAAIDRYLLRVRARPHDLSKPAGRRCCCRSTGQTGRRTDGNSPVLQRLGPIIA